MRDLSFLDQTPPDGAEAGLATSDPRFAHIARLDESRHSAEAADAAAALVSEGIWDIRLIVYIVRAAFLEDGLPRLTEGLNGLARLFDAEWERFGPASRRELHVQKSLAWLCERVEQALLYHEKKRDETWDRLVADAATVEAAAGAVKALVEAREESTQIALNEPTSRLLRALRSLAETQRASETHDAEDDEPEVSPASSRAAARAPEVPETLTLRPSPALQGLLAKLSAFEQLIERNEFRRAALVASDVQNIIDEFDPREYFPELFSTFGALLAHNIDSIAPQWEQRDSVAWRMLEQFYRLDLAGFVEDE